MPEIMTVCGREYPIMGYAPLVENGPPVVPIVDLPMMSDYKWQAEALRHRLESPENYPDEDVGETIARLCSWLEAHKEAEI